MTDITLEQRARELLAAEYRRLHFDAFADDIAADRLSCVPMTSTGTALRAIEAALRLSAGADGATFRALRGNDALQSDDEILHDDCITWGPPPAWVVGMRYDPALHVPARRRLAAAPRHETGEVQP